MGYGLSSLFQLHRLAKGDPNPPDQASAKLAVSATGINGDPDGRANKADPVPASTIDIHPLGW